MALLVFNGLLFLASWFIPKIGGPGRLLAAVGAQGLLFGGTLLMHALALYVFRRSGSFALAGNVFTTWIYGVVMGLALVADAAAVDGVLQWMLLVPVYAFLLMGARWGFFWTLMAMGSSGWLHIAEVGVLSADHLQTYWNWFSLTLIVVLCLLIYESVSQRLLGLLERERQRFAHAADHDALTGLRNRAAFNREIQRCVAEAAATEFQLALAYIDLDGFKAVNDTYGHQAGDEVLRVAARRLEESFRDNDLVCRLGGDEFAVILHPMTLPPPVRVRMEKALDRLREPMNWNGQQLVVTASVGVAVFPSDGATTDDLVERADAVMYRAKSRKNQVCLAGDGEAP